MDTRHGMDEVARSELEPAKEHVQFLLAMQRPAFRQTHSAMAKMASHHCLHGAASSELGGCDVTYASMQRSPVCFRGV